MNKKAIILMVIGIIVMSIPFVAGINRKIKEEMLYRNDFNNIQAIQNQITEDNQITQDNQVKEVDVTTPLSYKEGALMGQIVISKIDVDMPIQEGVSKQVLKVGAGHIVGTALPGASGNCVLAGHRGGMAGSYFFRLNELEMGDYIDVSFENQLYQYEVIEKKIIEPTDLTVLEQDAEVEILTLITCHPVGVGSHRLIIKAKRIEGS